jgi:WD repeat-containing protein 81
MYVFTALYGEQLILLQYLPHMGELIALCKRKLTVNLEAGLVGCLALLKHIIPYLCDATLMDQLQVCFSNCLASNKI